MFLFIARNHHIKIDTFSKKKRKRDTLECEGRLELWKKRMIYFNYMRKKKIICWWLISFSRHDQKVKQICFFSHLFKIDFSIPKLLLWWRWKIIKEFFFVFLWKIVLTFTFSHGANKPILINYDLVKLKFTFLVIALYDLPINEERTKHYIFTKIYVIFLSHYMLWNYALYAAFLSSRILFLDVFIHRKYPFVNRQKKNALIALS